VVLILMIKQTNKGNERNKQQHKQQHK